MFIQCMGLRNLTNVFGVTRLFMGVAGFFGSPVAAKIKESCGHYDYSFMFAGACHTVGSLVLLAIPVMLQNWLDAV